MTLSLKDGYFAYTLDQKWISKSMPYFLYIPLLKGRYEDIKTEYRQDGKKIDWKVGMIEAPKMFGMGWIGLADETGNKSVSGEFIGYKMVGDYSQFRSAWKQIMGDYTKIDEVYHIYLTDPNETPMEENITYIIFR